MKIAILSSFYPFRVGMAHLNTRLCVELSKAHEVKAFSFTTLYPNFLFPGQTQFVSKDDPVPEIRGERVLSSINPLSYVTTAKAINKYSPDVLIIPYWMSFLAPAFGVVCRLLKKSIKIVALVHNAIPHEKRFFDKSFAKFFFGRCDAFVVLSNSVEKDLKKIIPDARILLTPHPIFDHYVEKIDRKTACATLNIATNKKNILFFGLIREYKGLDLLIEAMSFMSDDYQLVIAGESYEDFGKYQDLIGKSPLKSNIKVFEQYIPDEMVTILFSAADVLILPYKSATQSGVVAAAYQLETPIIATNVGALGHELYNAKTGLVAPEVTADCIATTIRQFFSNPSKQAEYLTNIKNEKKRLSWENMAKSLESFFTEI